MGFFQYLYSQTELKVKKIQNCHFTFFHAMATMKTKERHDNYLLQIRKKYDRFKKILIFSLKEIISLYVVSYLHKNKEFDQAIILFLHAALFSI